MLGSGNERELYQAVEVTLTRLLLRFTGRVAHYLMKKSEVRDQGLLLTVSDEYLKSCKVENVLFRIWFQAKEKAPVK